jgi:hypothetical protein
MRKAVLKVKRYDAAPATPWMIDYRVDGKRRREFFSTKSAAESALTRIRVKFAREGVDALNLSDDLRIAALTIQEQLAPFGKTLRDAGEHYLKFMQESQRSITVRALTDEYLAIKKSKGLSFVHLRDLRSRYDAFC